MTEPNQPPQTTDTDTHPAPRRFIVVDLETTHLDPALAVPVEIGVVVMAETPGPGSLAVEHAYRFVPFLTETQLAAANPEALQVNRYHERRLGTEMADEAATEVFAHTLVDLFEGNTLVGANPAYDARILSDWLDATIGRPAPWHFRLYDVETATAALHGCQRIPSLKRCAALWNVDVPADFEHTALGDALTTARVLSEIIDATARGTNENGTNA